MALHSVLVTASLTRTASYSVRFLVGVFSDGLQFHHVLFLRNFLKNASSGNITLIEMSTAELTNV